jgi:hypothetical protein
MMRVLLFLAASLLCAWVEAPLAAQRAAPAGTSQRGGAGFNTGQAADARPWAGGDWVAYLTLEENTDLNSDGDKEDAVLQVVDVRTFKTYNLGLAVDSLMASDEGSPPVAIQGNTLAVLVSERDQGNKDLNGNGRATDNVLELVDLTTREVTNTRIPGRAVMIAGNRLAILTSELEMNKDLNGDRDLADDVLQIYDLKTHELWNTGLAAEFIYLAGDWAVAMTPEAAQGKKDLNGDGDTLDLVPQVIHLTDRKITNTRLAASTIPAALTTRLFAFGVRETQQGKKDLNGDGEASAEVLHVVDLSTMEITNVGWDATGGVAASGTLVAFATDEARQGQKDLNGDGDDRDLVAQRFDLTTRRVTNLKQDASGGIAVAGNIIAFITDEESQGKRDLNGDGDADDQVIQIDRIDPSGHGQLVNLRQAVSSGFALNKEFLAYRVSEAGQGNQDLNGDGDAEDEVLTVYLPASNQVIPVRQAATDVLAASERAVVFFTPESHQGEVDLNRNGNTDDNVCQIFRVR